VRARGVGGPRQIGHERVAREGSEGPEFEFVEVVVSAEGGGEGDGEGTERDFDFDLDLPLLFGFEEEEGRMTMSSEEEGLSRGREAGPGGSITSSESSPSSVKSITAGEGLGTDSRAAAFEVDAMGRG